MAMSSTNIPHKSISRYVSLLIPSLSGRLLGMSLMERKEPLEAKLNQARSLPIEIIEHIIDFLCEDKQTLSILSFVSKSCLLRSQFHLFHTVHVLGSANYNAISRAIGFFSGKDGSQGEDSPHTTSGQRLGSYVRTVHVYPEANTLYLEDYLEPYDPRRDIYHLAKLFLTFPNLQSIDLQGLTPGIPTDPSQFSRFAGIHGMPSVRSITIRDLADNLAAPAPSAITCLTHLFPNLEEMVVLLYMSTELPAPLGQDWNRNVRLKRLTTRTTDGFPRMIPVPAVRGVEMLDVPFSYLISQNFMPHMTTIAPSLVDLTIAVSAYHVTSKQLSRSPFRLSACPKLRKLTLIQMGSYCYEGAADVFGTIFPIILRSAFAVFDLNPENRKTSLRHVRVVMQKREKGRVIQWLRNWDWEMLEDIFAPSSNSKQLGTFEILSVQGGPRSERCYSEWLPHCGVEPLGLRFQGFIKGKLSEGVRKKLKF